MESKRRFRRCCPFRLWHLWLCMAQAFLLVTSQTAAPQAPLPHRPPSSPAPLCPFQQGPVTDPCLEGPGACRACAGSWAPSHSLITTTTALGAFSFLATRGVAFHGRHPAGEPRMSSWASLACWSLVGLWWNQEFWESLVGWGWGGKVRGPLGWGPEPIVRVSHWVDSVSRQKQQEGERRGGQLVWLFKGCGVVS